MPKKILGFVLIMTISGSLFAHQCGQGSHGHLECLL